jgi:rhodanese-related sulfurtransferase
MSNDADATGYSVEDARRLIAGGDGAHACVVDLRPEDDFADGHIPAAVRIEEPSREDLDGAGRGRRDVEIWVIVCEDGKRSPEVARELCGDGYDVCWLDGGMKAWSGDAPLQPRPDEEFEGPGKQTLY